MNDQKQRRQFLKQSVQASALMFLAPWISKHTFATPAKKQFERIAAPNRIKFAVINIDHPHIYGMTEAVKRGGGELVALYARQPELTAAFLKAFPEARLAKSEAEILEDPAIQLVLSSGIPDERAP